MFTRIVLASVLVSKGIASEYVQCLEPGNVVVSSEYANGGNKYEFDGVPYNSNIKIGLKQGIYTFEVPQDHPIRFYTDKITVLDCDNTVSKNEDGIENNFCYGTVKIEVISTLEGDTSYKCSSHGYMGGEYRLVDCCTQLDHQYNIQNCCGNGDDNLCDGIKDEFALHNCLCAR